MSTSSNDSAVIFTSDPTSVSELPVESDSQPLFDLGDHLYDLISQSIQALPVEERLENLRYFQETYLDVMSQVLERESIDPHDFFVDPTQSEGELPPPPLPQKKAASSVVVSTYSSSRCTYCGASCKPSHHLCFQCYKLNSF